MQLHYPASFRIAGGEERKQRSFIFIGGDIVYRFAALRPCEYYFKLVCVRRLIRDICECVVAGAAAERGEEFYPLIERIAEFGKAADAAAYPLLHGGEPRAE